MLIISLCGKQHYTVKAGAKIQFTNFDEDGNELGETFVVTNEDICVYIENTEVSVKEVK